MDDLMDRLRGVTGGKLDYTNTPNSLRLAAADRIEELEAKLAECEARLEKAVEGLHDIAKDFDKREAGLTDFGEREHYRRKACKLRDKARTTLTELSSVSCANLKGQKDEWKCPINHPNCEQNCGNYGCGN